MTEETMEATEEIEEMEGIPGVDSGIIDKAEAIMDEGLFEFCLHGGKVYVGGREHKSGLKQLTEKHIVSAYKEHWGASAPKNANYVDPVVLLAELVKVAMITRDLEFQALKSSGNWFGTVTEFCNYWLDIRLGWTYDDATGLMFSHSGYMTDGDPVSVPVDMGKLVSILKVAMGEYNQGREKDDKLSKDDIQHVLGIIITKRKKTQHAKVRRLLQFDDPPFTQEEVFGWAEKLLGIYHVRHNEGKVRREDILALLHMMWQIKRKIFMLPIEQELVYSWFSYELNLGKTFLLNKMASPFPWGYTTCRIPELVDKNQLKAKTRDKFIIDVLEMANGAEDRGEPVDIGAVFKSIFGSSAGQLSTTSGRVLYSTDEGTEYQGAVFVSSTNVHIHDIVQEPGGMRRYWEFYLKPEKGYDIEFYLAANPLIDAITDIYRSIDERNSFGYYHPGHPKYASEYTSMRKIQQDLTKSDAFTTWMTLHDVEVSGDPEEGFEKILIKNLLSKFNRYMAREEGRTKDFQMFYLTNILRHTHNIVGNVERVDGVVTKFIYVKGLHNPKKTAPAGLKV